MKTESYPRKDYLTKLLPMILLLVLLGTGNFTRVFGQTTVTIGTGTTLQSGGSPMYNFYYGNHVQLLYTAAEITAAGGPAAAALTSLGWNVGTAGSIWLMPMTISMANTSLTALTSTFQSTSGMTVVYSNSTYTYNASTGWQMFELSSPFVYSGGSILIDVCMFNPAGYASSYPYTYGSTTTDIQDTYLYTDVTSPCPTVTGNTTTTKANLRFVYCPVPGTVAAPTNFYTTAYTYSSINYTMTPPATGNVVVVSREIDAGFSIPSGAPGAVGSLFCGGTIIYKGTSFPQNYSIPSPTPCTSKKIYLKAWTYNTTNEYSCYGPVVSVTTPLVAGAPSSFSATVVNQTGISLTGGLDPSDNPVVYLMKTTAFVAGDVPVNGTAPVVGSVLAGTGATVVFTGTDIPVVLTSGLAELTTYYFKAYCYNPVGGFYSCSGALTATVTTGCLPLPPGSFTLSKVGNVVTLAGTTNASADSVIILYNNNGTFSTPSGAPTAIGSSFAAGTILYKGKTFPVTQTIVNPGTYYYTAYSYKKTGSVYKYSCSALTATTFVESVSCTLTLPYLNSFESITVAGALPSCVTSIPTSATSGMLRTAIANTTSYKANTGTKFGYYYYCCTSSTEDVYSTYNWYFFGPFNLKKDSAYLSSIMYWPSSVSAAPNSFRDLNLGIGTSATGGAMTIFANVKSPSNATYSKLYGSPAIPADGNYYIGVGADILYASPYAPTYLSVDDFSVDRLKTASTCVSSPVPATLSTGASLSQSVSWNADPFTSTYDVYFGPTNPPYYVGALTGTSYQPVGLVPNHQYFWKVIPKNAFGSPSDCPVWSFTTGAAPVPVPYCVSLASYTGDEEISNVTLNTINNSSNCASSNQLYTDYTAISTNLINGNSYPMSITQTTCGGTYPWGYAVYVDLNQDGVFDPITERLASPAVLPSGTGTVNFTITIPYYATAGPTRMRVIVSESSNPAGPCAAYTWGETEDYTVVLSGQQNVDMGVITNSTPVTGNCGDANRPVTIRYQNYGTAPASSYDLSYSIDNFVTSVTEHVTTPIGPGQILSYTFATAIAWPQSGSLTVKAKTILSGDLAAGNDVGTFVMTSLNPCKDLGVTTLVAPVTPILCGTTSQPVTIKYKNYGTTTQTNYQLQYRVRTTATGTPTVAPLITETVTTPIAPGAELTYTFTTPFTVPSPATLSYTFRYRVFLTGDANSVNDSVTSATIASVPTTGNWCNDLSAISISTPSTPFPCGPTTSLVTMTYKNLGSSTQSNYSMSYSADGGVTYSTAEVVTGVPITSGQTLSYTFTTPVAMPTSGTLNMRSKVTLSGDQNSANDAMAANQVITIGPLCNDLGVASIVSPTNPMPCGGATVPVTITYTNFGSLAQTGYKLQYATNNFVSGIVEETVAGTINAGQTLTYTFATPLALATSGTFTIYARTVLAVDNATANDATSLACTITPCKDLTITAATSGTTVGCGVSSIPVSVSYKNRGSQSQTTYNMRYRVQAPTGAAYGPYTTEPVINIINPGSTLTYAFATALPITVTSGTITVEYEVVLTGDQVAGNNIVTQVITVSPIIKVTDADVLPGPYFENFNTPSPTLVNFGYTSAIAGGSFNSWTLGHPAKAFINSDATGGALSTDRAWVTSLTGNYNNNEFSYVETPCFDLSLMLNPQVSMAIKYKIENKYDGVLMTYRIGSGDNLILGTLNEPTSLTVGRWFNDTVKPYAYPCWAGASDVNYNSSAYQVAKHPLTGLAGQSPVKIRVYLLTNGTVAKEGFAFDNFSIYESSQLSAFAANLNIEGTVGDTIKLKVKGGIPPYHFTWVALNPTTSVPNQYLSSLSVQRPVATPPMTTTYKVKVWDSNYEGSPAQGGGSMINGHPDTVYTTMTVFVYSALQFHALYNTTACDTANTQLWAMATGGVPPYNYHWSPASGLNLTNIYNPICDTNKTTTYKVTVTDAINFKRIDSVKVTIVHGFPVADVFPNPVTICANDTVMLTATGGDTYSWSAYPAGSWIGTPNSPSTRVVPNASGVKFTCVVGSRCGIMSDYTIVNWNPVPTASWQAPLPLSSVCIDHAPFTLTGGFPAGGVYSGAGVTNGVFYPAVAGVGSKVITYTVTNQYGCFKRITTSITVNDLPNTKFVILNSNFCKGATSPRTLIDGFPTGGVYSGPKVHGNIFYADSAALAIGNGTAYPYSYLITYTYTSTDGCTKSAVDTMFINNLPIVTTLPIPSVCGNSAAFDLTAYGSPAGGVFSGTGVSLVGGVYKFNPSAVTPGTVTTLNYCYTNTKGCSACATTSVGTYFLPNVTSVWPSDTATCPRTAVNLTLNFVGTAPWTVRWKRNDTLQANIVTSVNPYILVLNQNINTVYTFDSIGDGHSCYKKPLGKSIYVTINTEPSKFHVVLNDSIPPYGKYCLGTNGLFVGLDGAQVNMTYKLFKNGTYTGQKFIGNGVPFWFLVAQKDGVYTVSATDTLLYTKCSVMMLNSQTIGTDTLKVKVYSEFASICKGYTSWEKGVISNPWISNGSNFLYTWTPTPFSAPRKDSILESPLTTSYIKLYVVDALGCYGRDSVLLTVNNPPTVLINNGATAVTICAGASLPLTTTVTEDAGTTTSSYLWSPATGLSCTTCASPTASPTSNVTYHVTVTSSKGCTKEATIQVNVNPSPAVVFPNGVTTSSICANGVGGVQIPLGSSGSGSYSYLWSPAASLSSATVQQPTATPSVTTVYSVTITSLTAPYCSSVGTYTVVVDPLMTVAATGPSILCNGSTANLNVNVTSNGTAPFTYAWSSSNPSATTWLTSANTQDPSVIPPVQVSATPQYTTFTVTVTDAHGCTATGSLIIGTSSVAVAYAGPDLTICAGNSAVLNGSGGPTYAWSLVNTIPPNTPMGTSASVTVTPVNNGIAPKLFTYELRTNTSVCGPAVTNVVVTVNPKTTLSILGASVFCQGDATATFRGIGYPSTGSGYFAGPGITNIHPDTATFAPTLVGTYNITYYYLNMYGCTDSLKKSITVNPKPVITFSPASYTVCNSDIAFTLANGLHDGVAGGGTYTIGGVAATFFTPTDNQPGVYVVTYTYTSGSGCTNSGTFNITVNALPSKFTLTADNSGHICNYSPLVGAHIYLSNTQAYPTKYELFLNGGILVGTQYGAANGILDFGPQIVGGTYTIKATNANGCTKMMNNSVSVVIDQLPNVFSVSGTGSYCQGGAGGSVTVSNSIYGVNYEIYRNAGYVTTLPGVNGPLTFNNLVGPNTSTYTVRAVNATTGCAIWMTGYGQWIETPLPTRYALSILPIGNTASNCPGTPITIRLGNRGQGGVVYELYFNGIATGLIKNGGISLNLDWILSNPQAGVYTVVAKRNPLGCTVGMLNSVTLIHYEAYTWLSNPAHQHIAEGGNASFSAVATGSPVDTYKWQVSTDNSTWSDVTDGAVYSGSNTANLYMVNVPYSLNNTFYRLKVTGPCSYVGYSGVAKLYIDPVLVITFGAPQTQSGPVQNAQGNVNVCALPEVWVPVYITNADSIAAISLTLTYDNSLLKMLYPGLNDGCGDPYAPFTNCYPALAGGSLNGFTALGSNKFAFTWMTSEPANVFSTGHNTVKLFDLRFNASLAGGACYNINFVTNEQGACELAKFDGMPLNTTFLNNQICVTKLPKILNAGVANYGNVCENSDLHLFCNTETHPAGLTFHWTGPLGLDTVITGSLLVIPNATPANSGVYHVVAISNGVGCTDATSFTATVHPKPTVMNVTGGGLACAGSGVEVALSGYEQGTTYQLFVTTTSNPYPTAVAAPEGLGYLKPDGSFTFGPMWVSGDYTVLATTQYGCERWMNGSAHVQINAIPLWFNTIGGGHICVGDNGPGREIKLSGSQYGVQYYLIKDACCCDNGAVDTMVVGTGSPISFGFFKTAGWYSVVAMRTYTAMINGQQQSVTCQNMMVGCVGIQYDMLPTAHLTGGGTVCLTKCLNLHLDLTGKAPFQVTIGNDVNATTFVVTANASPATFQVCPSSTMTYHIVGITDANTCSNTGTGTALVTVNPLPVVLATAAPGSVCVGGDVTLHSTVTGNGPYTYVWTGPNFFASTDANPVVANVTMVNGGTYNLTVTDANGCTNTASTEFTVHTLPVIDVVGSSSCIGGELNLNAYVSGTGSYGFSWTGPNGFTSTEQHNVINPATAADAGVYYVTVTNTATGCVSTGSAELIVHALPVVTCAQTIHVCLGSALNLTASASGSGTMSYSWTGPNSFTSGLQNPSIAAVTNAAAGDYVVNVYDGNQCHSTCTTHVIVDPLPTACEVRITLPNVYCFGCIPPVIWLDCNSQIGVTYTLYRKVTGTENYVATSIVRAGDGDSISFGHFAVEGTYMVHAVNDVTGCASWMIGNVTVIQQAPPTATIHDTTICADQIASLRINLTGDTHWKIIISDGVTKDTVNTNSSVYYYVPGTGGHIPTPTVTTTYTVVLVYDRVCYNVGNAATLHINALPVKFGLVGGGYYCNGIGVNVGLNGSQAGITYHLVSNDVVVATVVGTGGAISFGPQTTGYYTAYAVNTATGCESNMTGSVSILADPNLSAFNVSGGGHYCFGTTGPSIFVSNTQVGLEYKLIKNSIFTGISMTAITTGGLVFNNVTDPGTYSVLAFDPNSNCTRNGTGSAVVILDPLPTATISGNTSICYGQGATLHVVLTGTAPWTIVITDNTNTKVHHIYTSTWDTIVNPLATTTYHITTVSDHNCQNSGSGSVTVTVDSPILYLVTGGGSYCAGGAGVVIGLSGSQLGVSYELFRNAVTTGLVVAGTGGQLNFGSFTQAGTYTVVATKLANNCSRTMNGSQLVTVNPLPVAYQVSGGGECCIGCTHVVVCVDNSDYGIVYELYINGVASGNLIYGNGQKICWPYATVAGIYTIKGTNEQTGCWSWMTGSATVVLWPTAQANISGGGTICAGGCSTVTVNFTVGTAPYSFSLLSNGGSAVVYNNIMTPSYTVNVCPTSNTAYTLGMVSDLHGCLNEQTSGAAIVNVIQLGGITIPSFASVCVNAGAVTLTGGYPAGGVYSGTGVDYNVGTAQYLFYPSVAGVGPHVITYTVMNNNGCTGSASSSILVKALPVAEFTGLSLSYCIDGQGTTLTGTPANGTFSGSGVIDNGNGTATFSAMLAGGGSHVVTYTVTVDGCTSSASHSTEVLPLPTVSISVPNNQFTYCLNAGTVQLIGNPSGGVFSGSGVTANGLFNPASGVGVHHITYTYSSSAYCTNYATTDITVLPLPEICSFTGGGFCCVGCSVPSLLSCSQVGYSYQLVRNGYQNMGIPVMGTGSAMVWDIYIAGEYTIVVTSPTTGCTASTTNSIHVDIIPQPVATTTGATSICVGQCTNIHVALIGYNPFTILFTNGIDTVSKIIHTGNTWDTLVCPTTTTTYKVSSIQDSLCGANGSGQATVVVNPAPSNVPTVMGGGATCANGNGAEVWLNTSVLGTNYTLYRNGTTTGVIVSGTGANHLSMGYYLLGGVYTVHQSSPNTCEAVLNGFAEVTVNALPSVSLSLPVSHVCANGQSFVLSGGSSSAGTGYYTINGIPGSVFDPSAMAQGSNAVIAYVVTDQNGCSNSATANIMVYNATQVSLNASLYHDRCFDAASFTLSGGSPANGTYYVNGLPVASFNPSISGVGTYTVIYSFTDGNNCTFTSAPVSFAVRALPNVIWQGGSACLGDAVQLSGATPPGGIYSGQNVVNGVFTPGAVGTYQVTYTYTDGYSCTKAVTSDIVVTSCAVYALSGTVTYDNTAHTPMTNTTVYLKLGSATVATTTTNASGAYTFSNLSPGAYHVTAATSKVAGGFNSNDALLINKHFVGIASLTGLRAVAGDVNGIGGINATDALLVSRRFVNLITTFPAGDWVFEANNVTITNSNMVNNFKALCVGDVNGSYTPSLAKTPATMHLNMGGVKEVKSYEHFNLPINVVGATKLGAISVVLNFNESLFEVEGVLLRNQTGSDVLYTAVDGELRISWYNTKEMSLNDGDAILTLQLRAKNLSNASASDLELTLDGISEIGDRNAVVLQNVNLVYPKLTVAVSEFSMSNYPNPFNTVTDITYSIPEAGAVSLKVYNMLGEEVSLLLDNVNQSANTYTVQFDAANLVAGVYTYKLEVKGASKDMSKTGKMIITR